MLNQQYIQYALWFFAISDISLGLYVYIKNSGSPINRTFFIMCFSVFLWVAGIAIFRSTDNLNVLSVTSRMYYIGAAWISLSFYFLSLIFPNNDYQKVSWQKPLILFFSIFFLLIILPTGFLIGPIAVSPPFNKIDIENVYYLIYSLLFLIFMVWGVVILFIKSNLLKGSYRLQVNLVLIGTSLAAIPGTIFNLFYPWFGNYELIWVGPILASLIWLIIIAYTIIAHRLFDIKVIIRRTVVYSVMLAFVLGIYSSVIFISASILGNPANMGRRTMIPNLIAALLIAVGFEPLRQYLTKITDKYLFKGTYEPEAVIKQLSTTLVSVVALDEALISMMNIITRAMRISHTAVIIIHNDALESNQVRVHSVGYQTEARNHLKMTTKNPIIRFFKTNHKLIVIKELARQVEDESVSSAKVKKLVKSIIQVPIEAFRQIELKSQVIKEAEQIEAAIIIPIIVRDKVIGILFVGPKLSGDSFVDDDLKMLEIVSSQTAQAIEQSRLYEEDQAKSEFVSIASHELLTPTSAIEGYLSMILDENMATIDKTAKKYLIRVYSSARRLSNLVKDLLSVSRIESGRIKINLKPTTVEPIIEGAVTDLLPGANEKKLSLKYLKTDKALPKTMIDGEKLTQIIINLVGNAIKYTKEGSILVLSNKEGDRIKIIVEDTGIGIKKEHIDHLFEKFYRVDNTETVGIIGSGLGLYITKSIIEMMNGTIEVESTEWKGSRFIVKLPIVRTQRDGMKVQSS